MTTWQYFGGIGLLCLAMIFGTLLIKFHLSGWIPFLGGSLIGLLYSLLFTNLLE